MEVDLLIGSDYYWSFVTGETRRGNGGPVAVRTMQVRLGPKRNGAWSTILTQSLDDTCAEG